MFAVKTVVICSIAKVTDVNLTKEEYYIKAMEITS